uniref:Uncharacterized protein n=1 Tax=Ciona intestinalis TaxID=7719 RepID=F6V8T1_CIOIN
MDTVCDVASGSGCSEKLRKAQTHPHASLQFFPGSLSSSRRTSTGSLIQRKRANTSNSHEYTPMCSRDHGRSSHSRKTPITGGSWDDNSVGHGSVAARMRRERNRAIIRRTQTTSTYKTNSIDTHARITSTLNLINTTALSPWQPHEEDKLPWDDVDDYVNSHYGNRTAASKRSAGSLCNINKYNNVLPESVSPWDSRSIPDRYTRLHHHHRYSFTSANHHSSPTSGCASIASSDLDSADLAFFSMTDDSSFFDGDSLFSDSYGAIDGDSGFSTNIFSLLEEGSISCRTPFPNGDWPDSISELDFDCSEPQNDISNCDAHSDIGPSCSTASTERNRLKKRQIRGATESKNPEESSSGSFDLDFQQSIRDETDSVSGDDASSVLEANLPDLSDVLDGTELPDLDLEVGADKLDLVTMIFGNENESFFTEDQLGAGTLLPEEDATIDNASAEMQVEYAESDDTTVIRDDVADTENLLDFDNSPEEQCTSTPNTEDDTLVMKTDLKDWNLMSKEERARFIEELSGRITKTMGLQEQLDIIRIIGVPHKNNIPFRMSVDDIDNHKLSKVLGYLNTHRNESPTKAADQEVAVESNLRRSNSDGNIPAAVSQTQKEHRW